MDEYLFNCGGQLLFVEPIDTSHGRSANISCPALCLEVTLTELDILYQVAHGSDYRTIALDHGVSRQTIKNQVKDALDRCRRLEDPSSTGSVPTSFYNHYDIIRQLAQLELLIPMSYQALQSGIQDPAILQNLAIG